MARSAIRAVALAAAVGLVSAPAFAQSDQNTDKTFATFKEDAFGAKPIEAGAGFIRIDAPIRAEDAATVPVDVAVIMPPGDARTIAKLTLVVDENPAPVAATFTLGQPRQEFFISTRLRVNAYSSVRAVVETSDGKLFMNGRFVKASGGCSAPALKDQDESLARLGQTRFRAVSASGDKPVENASKFDRAQLMIRHPNYSGLQMNVIDRSYIPAWFVDHIEVKQGDEMVFAMDGGISLSEDPLIQFSYHKKPGAKLSMTGKDTSGKTFSADLQESAAKAEGL